MLASDYANNMSSSCSPEEAFNVHTRFADRGKIILIKRGKPRCFTVFFSDRSFVKKVYLGNNQSSMRVYE